MKKLTQLGAGLNAYKFNFDESLLDEIRDSYARELHPIFSNPENRRLFQGGNKLRQSLGAATKEYFVVSFLSYPLLWLSSNTMETYAIYRRFFDRLDIEDEVKQLVEHDSKIVMYCGFLVVSEFTPEHSWHVDYKPGANAYSMLTPLFDLDPGHGDLLYKSANGQARTYSYETGEAIMFGDHFSHCTEPYESTGHLRVLLTLQFGTDQMRHWDVLRTTIESQSDFLILPCGHLLGSCECTSRDSEAPTVRVGAD
jgi:hypothetical protein